MKWGSANATKIRIAQENAKAMPRRRGAIDVATLGFMLGFAVMMSLDNALG